MEGNNGQVIAASVPGIDVSAFIGAIRGWFVAPSRLRFGLVRIGAK